jgi:hypothetical protein
MHSPGRRFLAASLIAAWGIGAALAQSPLTVYSDNLQNGFQDWGWATRNYANTTPVHSGSRSVSVTLSDASWQGIQIGRSAFDSTPYASVTVWSNGGPGGGQRLRLCGLVQIARRGESVDRRRPGHPMLLEV